MSFVSTLVRRFLRFVRRRSDICVILFQTSKHFFRANCILFIRLRTNIKAGIFFLIFPYFFEYFGFREALRRALRVLPPSLVFELDSMLIVMQMSGRWGCHRRHLRDLLAECYDLGEQLTQSGCAWSIRHIYREFNQVADKLAGDCLSNAASARASPSW